MIETEYTMRILPRCVKSDYPIDSRKSLTFYIRAHVGWAGSKICRLVWRAWEGSRYIYDCRCIIKSARYCDGVSRALECIRCANGHKINERHTYFAGQPSVKFVLDIRVVGSSISRRTAPSTAGSHSWRSSGVAKMDFQASKGIVSSAAGTSRMTLYTVSSDLLDWR